MYYIAVFPLHTNKQGTAPYWWILFSYVYYSLSSLKMSFRR